jgi:hypothetical protein
MSFIRYRGKTKLMHFRKTDTTHALRDGGLVQLAGDSLGGSLIPPPNDSTSRPLGVCRQNVAMTDTSFPTVPVEVPVENAVEWLIDVDSDAGAVDSDIGFYCGIDTTGGGSVLAGDSCGMRVDISDTATRQVFITGRVSASKIIGTLCNTAWEKGIGDSAMG